MKQEKDSGLNARVLGQLLVMQSIVSNLPDQETIFRFVCRGLADIPGVLEASYSRVAPENLEPSIVRIPLTVGDSKYGELWFRLSDHAAFAPYEDYLKNFGFMLAVIFEERAQRATNEEHQAELEQRVQERTRQLVAEIAERKHTEKELRESQHLLQSILNTTPESVYIYDLVEHCNIYVNREILQAIGYSPSDLQAMNDQFFSILLHPEDAAVVAEHHRQMMLLGDDEILEVAYRMKDAAGQWRWLHSRDKVFLRADDGSARQIVGIATDITERKNAETALKESESQFRLLAENSSDMISRHAPDGTYIYVSPASKSLLGYEPAELIGHSAFEFIHPDDLAMIERSRTVVVVTPIVDIVTFRVRCKDGDYIWLESNSHAIKDRPTGQTVEIQVSSRDVTERKQTEAALRESEQRYRDLFENMNDAFALHRIILDESGKPIDYEFLDVNPVFAERIGMRPEDVIGKRALTLFPKTEASWIETFGKVALTGEALHFTNYSVELDKYYNTRIYCPRPGYFAALFSDVTEQKQAEAEIRRLNEELEQRVIARTASLEAANQELEAFSYSVSHDLRAPLRAIDGYTRILTEEYGNLLDADGQRMSRIIRGETQRMGQLINDLLTLSRMGRSEMRFTRLDMQDMVSAIYAELTTPEMRQRIEFHLGALHPAEGDVNLMRQVWSNLLQNAIKFSAKKERSVIQVDSVEKETEIIYTICDNGAGFDMQYADNLFGVFKRLHSEQEFEGTGVGLAIVKRIIHRHNGRVWAESQVDKGSTFYVALPKPGRG